MEVNSSEKNKFYNDIYKNLSNFLLSICLMIIATLPFLFNILVKNDYVAAYNYIPILIIAIFYSNLSSFCGGIFAGAYSESLYCL